MALFLKRKFDIRRTVKAGGGEFSRATMTFCAQIAHKGFYIQHNNGNKLIHRLCEKTEVSLFWLSTTASADTLSIINLIIIQAFRGNIEAKGKKSIVLLVLFR